MHIPWFTLPPIDLDFIGLGKLPWFAVFVVTGIILGVMFYDRICLRGGDIDRRIAHVMPEAAIIGGFIGAHLVHVLVYHPELMHDDPWILFKFWAGISSIGGFLGGTLGVIAMLLYRRQPLVPYGDRILFALSIGWVFGRLGCATAHDHPGRLTDFFLGVAFHDGVRHDLGLYEFLLMLLVVVPLQFLISHRPWRSGQLMAAILLTYAPVRFGLDFLRASDRDFVDSRYWGLTPAQYGVMAMFAAGLGIFFLSWQRQWPVQPALWGKHAPPLAERRPQGSTLESASSSTAPIADAAENSSTAESAHTQSSE